MAKLKLDSNSEQNILNMLMDSSSLSTDQISKINATSPEIGKSKLETAIELNFTDESKIQKVLSTNTSESGSSVCLTLNVKGVPHENMKNMHLAQPP